jgi:nitrite reductase/ring-hydroxylating ferredoxin subunit
MSWTDACDASLPSGKVVELSTGGLLLAVARAGEEWYALDAWCTHADCPLTDGWVEERAIRCPCHASRFDLATGTPLEGPAELPVRSFPTRVVGGRVEVALPD